MTCPQVQTNLSLYLYGELEFAQEEALENHLGACAFCQLALAREKEWHASVNAERQDLSFELLSECRRDLRTALHAEREQSHSSNRWTRLFPNGFTPTRWSAQMAVASFLVFVGFAAARLMDSGRLPVFSNNNVTSMGLWDASNAHVRDIQPMGQGGVRIIVDRVQQQEVTGTLDDNAVRQLLLAAMQDSNDPGIRVDSVEMLQRQPGNDVRDALLNSIKTDSNAAVRIKALEGLRQFTNDRSTREAIEFVLRHDNSPEVRSEAVDILLPAEGPPETVTPDVLTTLQDILKSERQDEYVRSRSLEVMRALGASSPIY
jgi:hypothetical protein